ncbi:MAG: hypothetical protein HY235_01935 [Acidobacteria bacterium]|nr:hypothetical protein [Acidobacteriota bacterium]
MSNAASTEALRALENWFHGFLSLRRQVAFSVFLSIMIVPTLLVIQHATSARFSVTSYLLGFVCLFWVFHGGYCALYTPTLAKAAAETDIRMYWLNPADTGWIRTLSFSFNAMSLSEGIVLTLCITGMYWFRPWESRLAATVSLTWLAVGLAGISYGFLYPQFHLYRAIRREKTRQMLRVQQQLGVLALRLMQLDDEERKQLSQLVDLNSRLSGARETAVDPKAVGGYITSLIIPTLSFLAGHFKVGSALRSLFP